MSAKPTKGGARKRPPMRTLAGGWLPGGKRGRREKNRHDCLLLEAGFDYRKAYIALVNQLGYAVIELDRKTRGGQHGSRKKGDGSSRTPGGISLPTGEGLLHAVENFKEGDRNTKAAMRRLLDETVGYVLRAEGASEFRIKAEIDRAFVRLERNYYRAKPKPD